MSLTERIKYAQMKARHQGKLGPWYLKAWGIMILLIIAIIISLVIASSIYVVRTAREYEEQLIFGEANRQLREREEAIRGDARNQAFGPTNAPLTIVQFSDFACPACAQSAPTVLAMKNFYSDRIRFIYRDFPQEPANSIDLSLAAHCAGEQGKFWEIYEQLFAQQDRFIQLQDEELSLELSELSLELGLNSNRFTTCLNEETYLSIIAEDHRDGDFLQLEGTPTWFINNNVLVGHYPHDRFLELIDIILAEQQIIEQ